MPPRSPPPAGSRRSTRKRSAEDDVERRLAGADGMQQLAERAVHLLAEVDDHVAQAARCVGAQRRGRVVAREAAVLELGEHAACDQRAQDATEDRRARVHRVRDRLRRQRLRDEDIGDAQLRGDVECLRELVPAADAHHRLLGRIHTANQSVDLKGVPERAHARAPSGSWTRAGRRRPMPRSTAHRPCPSRSSAPRPRLPPQRRRCPG